MEDLSLSALLAIFRRRQVIFFATFGAIFAVTVLVTLSWSHYRAVVTVQIEQPYIPASIANVAKAEPADAMMVLADRRINLIQQRVLSIESLSAIIGKLNLYPGINKKLSADKLTDIMRHQVKLDFISSVISNPAAVQKESVDQLSAIAFTLSFDYNDPVLAKEALDAIVQSFIDEEMKQRQTQAEETASFLDEQLKTLEDDIKQKDAEVAQFKAKYGESGPAALMFNQQAITTAAMSLQNVDSQISTNEATQGSLRSQMATVDPYTPILQDGEMIASPAGQLKTLQAQLASLSGRYGPEHPDVLKLGEQIKTLKTHQTSTGAPGAIKRDADNPIYLQLSAQLSAAQAQHQSLLTQRAGLVEQQQKYEKFILDNPHVEQEMSQLSLDLDNSKQRYRNLKDKRMAAQMMQSLEKGTRGQRLSVINPASVPESTRPKRLYIFVGGLFMAIMGGLSMAILVEALSQGVRGVSHLTSLVGVAPLVSIPYIAAKP